MAKEKTLNSSQSPENPSSWEWLLLKAVVILLAGYLVFSPVFHAQWLWDDDQEITANPALTSVAGLSHIWSVVPDQHAGADYLPLKSMAQWIEWHIWQSNNTAYHVANITLHLLDCLLIWRLFVMLKIRGAWLAGLLFAIHPLLVESVAWVSEQKNTLSLAVLLLSMMAYINFDQGNKQLGYYVTSWLLFLAAILCKSSVIVFPFVILLYIWWKRGKFEIRELVLSLPFFAISGAFAALTMYFQLKKAINEEIIPVGGFFSRLATAGMSILFYFWKSIFPTGLLPIYPRWVVDPPALWQFLPWVLIIGVFVWLWTKRNTSWGKSCLFGLGFFVITLFPVLGFLTMSYMRITWVSDHLTYLPMIGLVGLPPPELRLSTMVLIPKSAPTSLSVVH